VVAELLVLIIIRLKKYHNSVTEVMDLHPGHPHCRHGLQEARGGMTNDIRSKLLPANMSHCAA